jgi:4-oxalocrotonate tautomerase family enzyme
MPTVFVYWSPGRTPAQKEKIVEEVTETLVEHGNARREDVLIIFQDIQPGDIGRAGKVVNGTKLPVNHHTPPDT